MNIYTFLKNLLSVFIVMCISVNGVSQSLPSLDENFSYLSTFSKNADKSWGDDDFTQIVFFTVPTSHKQPFYIRVYDADIGGLLDEIHEGFNSKTKFTVYGGQGAHSDPAAKKQDPVGNYKSGIELSTKTFGASVINDKKWISFGPFNPVEGELQPDFGGYVFKLIVEGLDGDDGNLYKLFLSSKQNDNVKVEGGNAFTYEYSVRLPDDVKSICHLYPFVSANIVAVKFHVFDYDNEGVIRIVSLSKKGEVATPAGLNTWSESEHKITKEEINTSLDIQLIKNKPIKNNNAVIYLTNQYGDLLPFFAVPIGGIPKFKYKIGVKVSQ